MTSFLALANFGGGRFPSKLVFGEAIQVFHGAVMEFAFSGVSYKETLGFFSCNNFSQPFPIFIAHSCSWSDCALGELLISLGNILIPHYFMFWCKWSIFQVQNTFRSKYHKISCKNVKQWRNSAISPLSCCANDFKLGEIFIIHFLL